MTKEEDKILTSDDDYKNIHDVEDPDDEVRDPGDYWDRMTAPRNEDDD